MKAAPDLSEFEAIAPKLGRECWAASLTPEQKEKIERARENGYSYLTISRVINGWGHKTSASATAAHLRGECRCVK